MPESTAACACCGNVKPLRLMRFVRRASDNQYEYLCDVCRKMVKLGELQR